MREIVLAAAGLLLLGACSSAGILPVAKPQVVEEETDSRRPTAPRDARTRAKLHTELGALYLQSGNLAVALQELLIAIDIDPNYAKAYSTRGLAHFGIREMSLADRDFQRALSLDGADPEISNNYGWFLCQIGREKEGIGYLQRALKNPLYETPERAYLNAGACYAKLGDLESAETFVQQSLRLTPGNPQAQLQLAGINYRRGDLQLASEQASELVRKAEPSAEALWLLVRIERKLGNRQAEARWTSQLRRRFPLSPEAEELLKGNFE
ncbi:type IV pilus biogenesis/stability protein PilW [Accumulibacter sp.]|uniref:type IV pilus biogenesis/stability protein PilW n=1 Tax=Accumulibacter sp. TaxID=2053492 RepID=UPI00261F3391|nr:type IV pilus biogenesis/stability protein PilW [Accumulibacter sp.]